MAEGNGNGEDNNTGQQKGQSWFWWLIKKSWRNRRGCAWYFLGICAVLALLTGEKALLGPVIGAMVLYSLLLIVSAKYFKLPPG